MFASDDGEREICSVSGLRCNPKIRGHVARNMSPNFLRFLVVYGWGGVDKKCLFSPEVGQDFGQVLLVADQVHASPFRWEKPLITRMSKPVINQQ